MNSPNDDMIKLEKSCHSISPTKPADECRIDEAGDGIRSQSEQHGKGDIEDLLGELAVINQLTHRHPIRGVNAVVAAAEWLVSPGRRGSRPVHVTINAVGSQPCRSVICFQPELIHTVYLLDSNDGIRLHLCRL